MRVPYLSPALSRHPASDSGAAVGKPVIQGIIADGVQSSSAFRNAMRR